MLSADTLCLDGPDVQEVKRRSMARVTIALCLVSKIVMARLSEVNTIAAGDLTRPLRYCVIRGLSSASCRLDELSRLRLYMAFVVVSPCRVVADGGGQCPFAQVLRNSLTGRCRRPARREG